MGKSYKIIRRITIICKVDEGVKEIDWCSKNGYCITYLGSVTRKGERLRKIIAEKVIGGE